MVARHDPHDLRRWLRSHKMRDAIHVAGNIEEAFEAVNAQAAIIASRPRDHVSDAMAVLNKGAHILVEKPLSDDALQAASLLKRARASRRVVAIGTEFSLLPALHQCAAELVELAPSGLSLHLAWDDPANEVRYGSRKARHEEVSLLDDLLPHAVSIFGVFAPSGLQGFRIIDRELDGNAGRVSILDETGSRYELVCRSDAEVRKRLLRVKAGDKTAVVDFTSRDAETWINGDSIVCHPALVGLDSSLRLEFGAFVLEVAGKVEATPITRYIDDHVRLASELAGASAGRADPS